MQKLVGFSMLAGFMNVRSNWRTPVPVERSTQAKRLTIPTQHKNQLYFGMIKPKHSGIDSDSAWSLPDAIDSVHLKNLERLQVFADVASSQISNFSNRRYAALIMLNDPDKTEGIGVNMEHTRELTTCDLPVALNNAMMELVKQQQTMRATGSEQPNPFKIVKKEASPISVKRIYLLNANPQGPAPIPCGNCQELLRYPPFQADTELIIRLPNQAMPDSASPSQVQKSAPTITKQALLDLLPLYYAKRPNPPAKPLKEDMDIASLKINSSDRVRALPAEHQLDERQLRNLIIRAKAAYIEEKPQSNQPDLGHMGAGVTLASPTHIHTESAGSMAWSTRMQDPGDLRALANGHKALEKHKQAQGSRGTENPAPTVQAIAYFSTQPHYLPSPASLDRILRQGGTPQTQIITVTGDHIVVRTLEEYMPFMYCKQK